MGEYDGSWTRRDRIRGEGMGEEIFDKERINWRIYIFGNSLTRGGKKAMKYSENNIDQMCACVCVYVRRACVVMRER